MRQSGCIYGDGSQSEFPVLDSGNILTWGKHVDFGCAFSSFPNVLVAPNQMDATADSPVTVTVKNITKKDFDFEIRTRGDGGQVWGTGVTWVAFDED